MQLGHFRRLDTGLMRRLDARELPLGFYG